jgi:hypothetical protein
LWIVAAARIDAGGPWSKAVILAKKPAGSPDSACGGAVATLRVEAREGIFLPGRVVDFTVRPEQARKRRVEG